jgi:GNAT superfamily N-acetyltransferase
MTSNGNEKLDNPVWHSLSETHRNFAIAFDEVKFYDPAYCPFGSFININQTAEGISNYAKISDHFYLVGNKPQSGRNVVLVKELVCNQMLLDQPVTIPIFEEIQELNDHFEEELFQLVNLVQPGYFRSRTSQLGRYFGIFNQGILVAVAGERMQMDGYTEVSAIVTHPEHIGKGYAKQLIAHLANLLFREHKIPFLHVAKTNAPAITLYEKLGFIIRREISFWNFARNDMQQSNNQR